MAHSMQAEEPDELARDRQVFGRLVPELRELAAKAAGAAEPSPLPAADTDASVSPSMAAALAFTNEVLPELTRAIAARIASAAAIAELGAAAHTPGPMAALRTVMQTRAGSARKDI